MVYDYGLVPQDVLDRLPRQNSLYISATSIPVNTGHLEEFIIEGSGRVNSAMAQRGIVVDATLDAGDHARLKALVLDYCVAETLYIIEGATNATDEARTAFNQGFSELTNRPQQLASAPTQLYSNTTQSQIEQRAGHARDIGGRGLGYERWSFIGLDPRDDF